MLFRSRCIELSTLQRCAGHLTSRTDITEAYQVGGAAAKAAFEGVTGQMVASLSSIMTLALVFIHDMPFASMFGSFVSSPHSARIAWVSSPSFSCLSLDFSKFRINFYRLLFPESHQWKKQPSVCRNYIRGAVLRYRCRTCSVPPDFALYE